jgi:hypothetical protein
MTEPTMDEEMPTAPGIDPLERWDDPYLSAVARRLRHHYDLEQAVRVAGHHFPMVGHLQMTNHKHLFHPSLRYADHSIHEHVLVTDVESPSESTVQRMADVGHTLASDPAYLVPSPEHYSTTFTFVLRCHTLSEPFTTAVKQLRERTLLRRGYHGRYTVEMVAVNTEDEQFVASAGADIAPAFATWAELDTGEPQRLSARLVTAVRGLFSRGD